MKREECKAHIEKMLAGETPINLKLMRMCAFALGGSVNDTQADEASDELVGAVELLDAAMLHQMPASIVDDIRKEARQALIVMLMVASANTQGTQA